MAPIACGDEASTSSHAPVVAQLAAPAPKASPLPDESVGHVHLPAFDPRNSKIPADLPRVVEGLGDSLEPIADAPRDTAPILYAPSAGWAASWGNTLADLGTSVALDGTNNMYVTGYFQNSISFGSNCSLSTGSTTNTRYGIFIGKLSVSGSTVNCNWLIGPGTNKQSIPLSIVVDTSGNSYIAGFFSGSITVNGFTLTSAGGYDAFIVSFDSSGNFRWYNTFGGPGDDLGYALAYSPKTSTIVMVGEFAQSVKFGASTFTSAGGQDIFVTSMSASNGAVGWAKRAGGTQYDTAAGVAVDSSSNVYVTGAFQGTANFGGTNRTSAGGLDAYVAAYSSSGAWLLDQTWGGVGDDAGTVAAAQSGSVLLLSGYFYGTVSFSTGSADAGNVPITLTGAGRSSTYVGAFKGPGLPAQWVNEISAATLTQVQGIFVDSSGNAFVSGQYTGASGATFTSKSGNGTPVTVPNAGGSDMYIAKYASTDGTLAWASHFGGTGNDQAIGLGLTSTSSLIVTGGFSNTITIGTKTLTASGYSPDAGTSSLPDVVLFSLTNL